MAGCEHFVMSKGEINGLADDYLICICQTFRILHGSDDVVEAWKHRLTLYRGNGGRDRMTGYRLPAFAPVSAHGPNDRHTPKPFAALLVLLPPTRTTPFHTCFLGA